MSYKLFLPLFSYCEELLGREGLEGGRRRKGGKIEKLGKGRSEKG